MTVDILERIDATLAAVAEPCPCGAPPRPDSRFCGPDCDPGGLRLSHDAMRAGDGRSGVQKWQASARIAALGAAWTEFSNTARIIA